MRVMCGLSMLARLCCMGTVCERRASCPGKADSTVVFCIAHMAHVPALGGYLRCGPDVYWDLEGYARQVVWSGTGSEEDKGRGEDVEDDGSGLGELGF
jgi:hypothetical protein